MPWDPVHVKVCVHLLRMGSPFPPFLRTSPTGLQCQMLQGLFLPVPDPYRWKFDVGLRTLTPVGDFVNQLVSSPWDFPPVRYGIVYIT